MRILVAGSYRYEMYEKALYNAFLQIGEEAFPFIWDDYRYKGKNSIFKFFDRFQERYLYGPQIRSINKGLVNKCYELKPDLLFIYRGTHIRASAIKKIAKMGIKVFSYNNDDPFSCVPSNFYWRHYIKSIKVCDHNFAYRQKNVVDFKDLGLENTSLLRSYYIDAYNFSMDIEPKYDVIFVGHFEEDGRDKILLSLINEGIHLNIFGDDLWKKSQIYEKLKNNITLGHFNLIEYNHLLNSTKIALVFLSKHNNDTYTRRCFEIPAVKVMMISEYTDDLSSMFDESKEIAFFSDEEELKQKINYYLNNDKLRESIAINGYNRLISDKHEIKDRAREILSIYNEIQNNRFGDIVS